MADTFLATQVAAVIAAEMRERVVAHQAAIARLKSAQGAAEAGGQPTPKRPLVLLAHGDSWFDYPLNGNEVSLTHTDVIAQLAAMGGAPPVILNLSHYGDATTDELSLPKQQRLIQALQDPNNWFEAGKPDAILFSGGGNDIAGEKFCIFLDHAAPGAAGLNEARFAMALRMVEASYLDLFAFRDRYAGGTTIFGHSYDFPIPDGRRPCPGVGPWLLPSLQFCNWTVEEGTAIVKEALSEFCALARFGRRQRFHPRSDARAAEAGRLGERTSSVPRRLQDRRGRVPEIAVGQVPGPPRGISAGGEKLVEAGGIGRRARPCAFARVRQGAPSALCSRGRRPRLSPLTRIAPGRAQRARLQMRRASSAGSAVDLMEASSFRSREAVKGRSPLEAARRKARP